MNIVLFTHTELHNGEVTFYKNDERYKHIKKVLKLQCGDILKTGEVNGFTAEGFITYFDEEKITFTLSHEKPSLPLYNIKVILGIPRPIQLGRILRDAASLGISALYLCGTELGEKSYLKSALLSPAEIKKFLLAGASQAGSPNIPHFEIFPSIQAFFNKSNHIMECAEKLLLDIDDKAEKLSSFKCSENTTVWAAIGSERDWSLNERQTFYQNGFSAFSMGHRILRTETAFTASVAALILNADS